MSGLGNGTRKFFWFTEWKPEFVWFRERNPEILLVYRMKNRMFLGYITYTGKVSVPASISSRTPLYGKITNHSISKMGIFPGIMETQLEIKQNDRIRTVWPINSSSLDFTHKNEIRKSIQWHIWNSKKFFSIAQFIRRSYIIK